jgi:TRAP-type uncharacterized transport system fused permease subunit
MTKNIINPASEKEDLTPGQKKLNWLFLILCVGTALFHLYTAGIGTISATIQRVIHLMLVLTIIYLCRGGTKRSVLRWIVDIAFSILITGISVYYVMSWLDRTSAENFTGFIIADKIEIYMGIIMILLVLEATRRTTGPALVIVVVFFLAYALLGENLPGFLGHKGYTINRMISYLYLTSEGIYGPTVKISANYIVLFVIFGAILEKTGGGQTFIELGYSLLGRFRGCRGQTAVVSRALMGAI